MAIIPNTATTIKCDGIDLLTPCRHQATIHQVTSVTIATRHAQRFGWAIEESNTRCPECKRFTGAQQSESLLLAA